MKLSNSLETILENDRRWILGSFLFLAGLAWGVLVYQSWDMGHGAAGLAGCPMPASNSAWGVSEFWAIFIMWLVMMVAMMVPSAIPMILTFASVNRKRQESQSTIVPTWIFLSGYLIVWAGFSLGVTLLQGQLYQWALLSPMMEATNRFFSGSLLLLAGAFQWSPLKNTCLTFCQSPFIFLMTSWREGKTGALFMGLRHGIFCTGWCWALMALLFVFGVMNLRWVAVLSIFVLLEKLAPRRWRVNRFSGLMLIGGGFFSILYQRM